MSDDECPGFGNCHGCRTWCPECGDTSNMCQGPICDTHPPCIGGCGRPSINWREDEPCGRPDCLAGWERCGYTNCLPGGFDAALRCIDGYTVARLAWKPRRTGSTWTVALDSTGSYPVRVERVFNEVALVTVDDMRATDWWCVR